ncbi:MAG: glycosyltransferase family 2 protein [Pseudazoarcus pumilus]|nr:glycosyltransferase family 2 protein [Pseudazoarcus pumilus]
MASGELAVQTASPRVAILLCTYNGAGFLGEQLDSIEDQTHSNWEVWASDDGSTDDTLAQLADRRAQWPEGRLHVVAGPQRGFAANFLSLACRSEIEADYFAFCDQDDVWEADKLKRAVDWIKSVPTDVPALYCARTRLVDVEGREIGLSPLFSREPGFGNALVQSLGGGNTMLLNNAARDLLCLAGPGVQAVAHDWWAYILVSGCRGRVHYDPYPVIRYRQHGGNLIGRNSGLRANLARASMLIKGRFRGWNERNLDALECVRMPLPFTNEAKMLVEDFRNLRKCSGLSAVRGLRGSGIYRQTRVGNLGLVFAALLGRL